MNMEKEVLTLNIEDILPNRFQPRIKFKEENINELAESIKEHGVIQPIVVRKISDKYEIIAGERRYKASILAGKTTIPAIITDLDDKNSAEVALIENVQRQNLTPIEEAISYKKILDMGYISQTDLAEKLGKTQSTIANKLRLLNLEEEVQEALLNEKISERHARSLLKLKKNQQVGMLNRIIHERMTVRKTDEAIQKMLEDENNRQETLNNNPQKNSISEKNISSPPKKEQKEPEIEILDFDIDEDKSSDITEEKLEKTMELPIINIEKEQSNMNNNEFNIPTSPIIETENNNINNNLTNTNVQPTQMNNSMDINSIVDNQSIPSSMANQQMNNNFNNFTSIEQPTTVEIPGFQGSFLNENNNPQPQPLNSPQSIQLPIEENSSTESSSGGKFFNMFNMNNQDTVDDIENQQVNMNFNEKPAPSNPFDLQFNNNTNIENSVNEQNNYSQTDNNNDFMNFQNLAPSQESDINTNFQNNSSQSEKINSINNMNPINNSNNNSGMSNDPFENKLNPYSLNDDQQFTNISDISNTVNNSITNQVPISPVTSIENSFINPTPVSNQNIQPQENGDLRMVINTIRDCASNIEKYGFHIDVEELDFENMYQVIFKIDKQ